MCAPGLIACGLRQPVPRGSSGVFSMTPAPSVAARGEVREIGRDARASPPRPRDRVALDAQVWSAEDARARARRRRRHGRLGARELPAAPTPRTLGGSRRRRGCASTRAASPQYSAHAPRYVPGPSASSQMLIRMARDRVDLARELRHPEVVDDVGGLEAHEEGLPTGMWISLAVTAPDRVAHLPPPLVPDDDEVRCARSAGGSERAIVSTVRTNSHVTMAMERQSIRFRVCDSPVRGGSSPSGRARKRTSE